MTEIVPAEFDWVSARAKCSIESVFAQLQTNAKDDVDRRNKLGGIPFFEIKASPSNFSVIRIIQSYGPRFVRFALRDGHIEIEDNNKQEALRATVGLNNKGECVLRIAGEELFRWQLLKCVLEDIFFSEIP